MSPANAWALMFLNCDTQPPTVVGVDIFGEMTPTTIGNVRHVEVMVGYGKDFHEAVADIKKRLDEPFNAWLKPILNDRARQILEMVEG